VDAIGKATGIQGGLCVQIGGGNLELPVALATSGRFLVQTLDTEPAAVALAERTLRSQGVYGLASADRLRAGEGLPYAEDLVNLLIFDGPAECDFWPTETVRVLCPGGVVMARGDKMTPGDMKAAGLVDVRTVQLDGDWVLAHKPWPDGMDAWPHPRHAADGNAVSDDRLVAPPRRIRWVAGPPQEISNMVTSAGRAYYAGTFARDAFNGLKLWQRDLSPSPARGGYGFRHQAGSVRPVAVGENLLVVTGGKLTELDGATGLPLREFPAAGTPADVLHVDSTLITIDGQSVRTLEAEDGSLRWKVDAVSPRAFAAGDGHVQFIHGTSQRGGKITATRLDVATGKPRWARDDLPWLGEVDRCVYDRGLVAYEVSTFNDNKENNRIHVVSAADGKPLYSHTFVPGTAHWKQARAMFIGERLWVLDDHKCVALDRLTGEVKQTYPAGWGHCFPPVATNRFLFSGELSMTDLLSGEVDANRITKGACGRDAGFVPAYGLIYVFPKHCICWPMLRGYAALAPERTGGAAIPAELDHGALVVERAAQPPSVAATSGSNGDDSWPCYRHDAWRSGSTSGAVPAELRVLWAAEQGGRAEGPIASDWTHNPFLLGPITPPVVADGKVFVARGDAHEVVALDAETGKPCWRFTANGRIDSAPTIHDGMCLFGTKSGWVYGLRADDGQMVWRLRAAPVDERIVAYGQLESPWPVPGSVLVADDVAFFAAGRQSLADGGILLFAVEPASGEVRWVKRLDSVPQQRFYGGLGLEFDNFDLLHRENDCVTLSRWLFRRQSGKMRIEPASGFAHLRMTDEGTIGGAGVMFPRGCWSYAPRNESEKVKTRPNLRPLAVFRGQSVFGCLDDKRTVYRRDFDPPSLQGFNAVWSVRNAVRQSGDGSRARRMAKGAAWSTPVLQDDAAGQTIHAMVLASDKLLVAGSGGKLQVLSIENGTALAQCDVPAPAWDGMAVAAGCVFVTTADGHVVCLGKE